VVEVAETCGLGITPIRRPLSWRDMHAEKVPKCTYKNSLIYRNGQVLTKSKLRARADEQMSGKHLGQNVVLIIFTNTCNDGFLISVGIILP
jgi:hypothetical protein